MHRQPCRSNAIEPLESRRLLSATLIDKGDWSAGYSLRESVTAGSGKTFTTYSFTTTSNEKLSVHVVGRKGKKLPFAITNSSDKSVFNKSKSLTGTVPAGTYYITVKDSDLAGFAITAKAKVTMNGGTLQLNGSSASTTVSAGSLTTTAGGTLVSSGGKLDLNNNELVVHDGTLAAITNELKQGFNGGQCNGSAGIISSTANGDSLQTLGVSSDVMVKYPYYGDADLSGVGSLAPGTNPIYNPGLNTALGGSYSSISFVAPDVPVQYLYYGDADLNGVVNGNDYSLIDNAFNNSGKPLPATPPVMIAMPG